MKTKTKTDLAEKFARLYYAEVDPEELAARASADLQGAAAAHLELARKFSGSQAKVRAYNPQPAQHGWQSTHSVVEIVNDDMPFLVDSVTMEVNRQGLTLHLVIHPVLRVARDAAIARAIRLSSPRSRRASPRCSTTCARRSRTGARCRRAWWMW